MHKIFHKHQVAFGLLILIIIGSYLRFFRLSELFHFTYDEEIIAFVGKRMWVNLHIPFIGGVTPMHVHVAPYFYWLSGIVLGLSNLNPLGWGISALLVAVATMCVLYFTGKTLFSVKVGLIAVFLYAFSFYQVIFDRHWWGLILDGLWSLLTLVALKKILDGDYKYTWVLATVWFFAFHTDPSTLVLYLLSAIVLLIGYFKPHWLSSKRVTKIHSVKLILILIGSFILSTLPLIVFDIRHNFSNSRGLLQYIDEIKQGRKGVIDTNLIDSIFYLPRTLARSLYVYGNSDLSVQYSYCPQHSQGRLRSVPLLIAGLILFSVVAALGYSWWKKRNRISIGLISLLFVSTYIGVVLYGLIFKGDLFDHYLTTLLPPFYLLAGHVLFQIRSKPFVIFVLAIFFGSNFYLLATAHHRFGYSDKRAAVSWVINQTGMEPYSLDVLGSCFRYNGYRYITYQEGKEPVKSYVDANFTYLYDNLPSNTHPRLLAVITNPDFVETKEYQETYAALHSQLIKKAQFGDIEVLLINNENLKFTHDY